MKYAITVFVTAVLVFLASTVYYKGFPKFTRPQSVSVTVTESPTVSPEPSSPTVQQATASATPTVNPETIISAVKKALIKKYGEGSADMNVTLSEVQGEYAKGMVTEGGGGGMWFAARLNGTWTLVWDGNGTISCTDVSPYPLFPASMIPECFDEASGKIITR